MTNIGPDIDRNRTVVRARALRRSMTLPEGLLWRELRGCRTGFKFRRQHPLGPYIVDFYCPAARLVIELDGESHNRAGRPEHDARREALIANHGLRLVRFTNRDVLADVGMVLKQIVSACCG